MLAVCHAVQAIGEEERRFNELVSINTTSKRQVAALQDKLSRIEQQVCGNCSDSSKIVIRCTGL